MPDRYRLFRNDNIRTAHLKCESCQTQIFLSRIERPDDLCEVRVFQCPHCERVRTLRIEAPNEYRSSVESVAVADRSSC
jgi:hypothetical protein